MRRRRKLWIILLALPFVLVAADTAYWHVCERNLENSFSAWVAGQRMAGWTVVVQPPVGGGWPFAATLTVPGVSLQTGSTTIQDGLGWSAERLTLRLGLLRPDRLDVLADGKQRLRVADGPEIAYTADRMRLVLPLQMGIPAFADLKAEKLRAGVAGVGGLTAGSLHLHLNLSPEAATGEPAAELSFQAEDVTPPPPLDRTLGPRIGTLAIEGALDGPIAPVGTLAERATAWRDGGGSLEIHHLAVNWGPLDLTGSATLALDEQLQPMGAGSARAVGYAETLDVLAAHGAITRSAATAAKAVLSLLAHNPDDGSAPDVEVPLTLQYRTLSMRQVPLMRFPEIDWPGG